MLRFWPDIVDSFRTSNVCVCLRDRSNKKHRKQIDTVTTLLSIRKKILAYAANGSHPVLVTIRSK